MVRDNINEQIFNLEFVSRLRSIHPLILSVIVVVCGGVYYTFEKGLFQLHFSPQKIHRESSVLTPLLNYFDLDGKSHSNSIERLIKHYRSVLETSSPADTSSGMVDTVLALICLEGLSRTSNYRKYESYQVLPLALDRLKWNWYHLMLAGQAIRFSDSVGPNLSSIRSDLQAILDGQNQSFVSACRAALTKLQTFDMGNLFDMIGPRNDWTAVLTYLPGALHHLYFYTIDSSHQNADSLPVIVFLLECFQQLRNISGNGPQLPCAITILKPFLMEHSLENYALAFFRETYKDMSYLNEKPQLCDSFFTSRSFSWDTLIIAERQRLAEAKDDCRLFALSISLARVAQAWSRLNPNSQGQTRYKLPSVDSARIYRAISNISNPILRIVGSGILLDMNQPLIFVAEQRDDLRNEMIGLLYSLIPNLPLSTAAYLFIRCQSARLPFAGIFKEMATIIGRKLTATDPSGEQDAAFLALRQIEHRPYLAEYLSEFTRKTTHLSDFRRFNSTVFYRYFREASAFPSCNISLLSIMYLNELTFDISTMRREPEEATFSFVLAFQQLWRTMPRTAKKMTVEIAELITEYLPTLSASVISSVIECITRCVSISGRALPVMQQWVQHQPNEDLVQYAALELIINGSDTPGLLDIVKRIFVKDECSRLIFVANRLFNSPRVDPAILREVLVFFQGKVSHASKVSVSLNRLETLQLLLKLDFQSVNSTAHRPLLFMIDGCSIDLQVYLYEYLRVPSEGEKKDVAVIVQWTLMRLTRDKLRNNLFKDLYEYFFSLLHDQQYTGIQRAIANALDAVFRSVNPNKNELFMQVEIKRHLEHAISNWSEYPKDTLATCLLCYGNCLLRVELIGQRSTVPDQVKEMLEQICTRCFPEILGIRASFCLMYMDFPTTQHRSALYWFRNRWHVTVEMTYQILLHQTLYRARNDHFGLEEIVEHLSVHPASINRFVLDLFDYISYKPSEDDKPDYLNIAHSVCNKHAKEFSEAVRSSSFGEKNLLEKLYVHTKAHPNDARKAIDVQSAFGIVTFGLSFMLGSLTEDPFFNFKVNFTQVSDRQAVEIFFDLLDRKRYHPIFKQLLCLLKSLAAANALSLFEIHERLPIVKNVPYELSLEWCQLEQDRFDLLLSMSCFKNEKMTRGVSVSLSTKADIDEEFDLQATKLQNELNLPCKANPSVGRMISGKIRWFHA
jgi:hypothetical protein